MVSRPWGGKAPPLGTTSLDIKKVMSKGWVVGFTEAEGSFYSTRKDTSKIVHGFGITQKLDPIVLNGIRQILHISSKVKYRKKHNFYMLDTTQKRSIENICTYHQGNLVGMKSFESKVRKRSLKYRNNFAKLLKIQQTLRSLRPQLFLPGFAGRSKCAGGFVGTPPPPSGPPWNRTLLSVQGSKFA